jgi:transposase/predicted nucleic acid-binding Zn finger protein
MDARQERGMIIAATKKLVQKGKIWLVPSQSGNGKYTVCADDETPFCSCPDHEEHGKVCKHIFAVRFTINRENGENGTVTETETMTITQRKTYKKIDWPTYDHCQMTEKNRFQELLHDLCKGIAEPVNLHSGRKPNPLADQIFGVCLKVYVGMSFRRFSCDLDEAVERGYMSRTIHPLKIAHYLNDGVLTPVLEKLIVQSSLPLRAIESTFAVDSTGFSTSRFDRWFDEKYGTRSGRVWVKAHVMTGVKTNTITAAIVDGPDVADCPQFRPLTETTAANFRIKEVSADKAYLSRENLQQIHDLGASAYIPFKSNNVAGEKGTLWEKAFNYFQFKRDEFLEKYHQRSLVESTFSMCKAKFGDCVRAKTDVAMRNEVLCKFLCHNICCLIAAQHELGVVPIFWAEAEKTIKEVAVAPVEVQNVICAAVVADDGDCEVGNNWRFSD